MVSYTVLALVAVASLLVSGIVIAVGVWVANMARTLKAESSRHHGADSGGDGPRDLDISSLRMLSQRLAVLEGSLQPMQQVLDGYAALAARLAAVESSMPSLVDAYDKFSQTTLNAEKRRDTRERNLKKKGDDEEIPMAEAVERMGMAANPEPQAETKPNGRPAGVLGRGGK